MTIPDRPRTGQKDKDITQDQEGNVLFKDVNLMNFGDPLRAFTWVEDYVKNTHAHGHIKKDNPIIRSFLITIDEYKLVLDTVLEVDSDRAPGQVRAQSANNLTFKAVPNSLVSFTDQKPSKEDGKVIYLKQLGATLCGELIHPTDLAPEPYIAHQHGRPIEGSKEKYIIPNLHQVIQCRMLERNLSGHGLEPKSSLSLTDSLALAPKNKYGLFNNKKSVTGTLKTNQSVEKELVEKAQRKITQAENTAVNNESSMTSTSPAGTTITNV